jgi:hypothetical protein
MMGDFKLEDWVLTPEQVREFQARQQGRAAVRVPEKIRKRRGHFVKVPMAWVEKLEGAHGQTWRLAMFLLYTHWKDRGEPVKLSNGMLRIDGIPRTSKWRALRDLETRGLVAVQCRPRRSPIVRVLV